MRRVFIALLGLLCAGMGGHYLAIEDYAQGVSAVRVSFVFFAMVRAPGGM